MATIGMAPVAMGSTLAPAAAVGTAATAGAATGASLAASTGGIGLLSGGAVVPVATGVSTAGAAAASGTYLSASNAAAAATAGTAASGGLMASIGAAMPWLAAAAILVSIFRRKKPKMQNYTTYSDLPRYDLQNDMRLAQDRMFDPSIASGTTPVGLPGGGPIPGITGYDIYAQGNSPMLGLSGFGSVRGFGGYGGGTMTNVPTRQMFLPQQWTGFGANTNYGSGVGILNAPTKARTVTRLIKGSGDNLQRQAIEKMSTFTTTPNLTIS